MGEVRWHVRRWATFNNGHSFWVPSIRKAGLPHVTFTHCVLHRCALAVKTLPPDLISVIFEFVKIVNHIRCGGEITLLLASSRGKMPEKLRTTS